MILDINNEECKNEIMLWAKAKGLLLAKTHKMPTFSNAFVIRNKEELNSIKDQLPEKFCMRADYRLGNNAVKVKGQNGTKRIIESYLESAKNADEAAAILVYYGDKFYESYNTDGAFYVDFNVKNAVYIDYVGKGFDGRGISNGVAFHETFSIPWDEVQFFQESKMEKYRTKLIKPEEYLVQRELRINSLIKEDLGNNMQEKAKREFLETKIPKEYKPISHGRMQEIKDKIIFPLMNAKDLQYQYKEYIAMCNIEYGEIRVAEIYRSERHLNKEYNIR